jgi:hypothetical protein
MARAWQEGPAGQSSGASELDNPDRLRGLHQPALIVSGDRLVCGAPDLEVRCDRPPVYAPPGKSVAALSLKGAQVS